MTKKQIKQLKEFGYEIRVTKIWNLPSYIISKDNKYIKSFSGNSHKEISRKVNSFLIKELEQSQTEHDSIQEQFDIMGKPY